MFKKMTQQNKKRFAIALEGLYKGGASYGNFYMLFASYKVDCVGLLEWWTKRYGEYSPIAIDKPFYKFHSQIKRRFKL